MAVYSCCKLIYLQIMVRAADQIVAKTQFFNFGVWGCLYYCLCIFPLCTWAEIFGGLTFPGNQGNFPPAQRVCTAENLCTRSSCWDLQPTSAPSLAVGKFLEESSDLCEKDPVDITYTSLCTAILICLLKIIFWGAAEIICFARVMKFPPFKMFSWKNRCIAPSLTLSWLFWGLPSVSRGSTARHLLLERPMTSLSEHFLSTYYVQSSVSGPGDRGAWDRHPRTPLGFTIDWDIGNGSSTGMPA